MPSTTLKKPDAKNAKSGRAKYRKDDCQEHYLYKPVPPSPDAIGLGMMYPASYQIAMSSLGYLVLFKNVDINPNVDARRIYADTLNDHNPADLPLMGFSFAFELDIAQILETFKTYDIPFLARDRMRNHPLIFAGGPVPMSNPEPFADFFDFFLIGEGEEMMAQLVDAYTRYQDIDERELLIRKLASAVKGLYAPSLYEVSYTSTDGPIASITPRFEDVPFPVEKQIVSNMDDFVATSPIISEKAIFSNTFLVEVMRGCAHRCRFCLASYTMLGPMGSGIPAARGGTIETVINHIEAGIQYTNKVGLIGALISDHPEFSALCEYFDSKTDLTVSSSSLRVDTLTPQIANTFKKAGQKQLTLAIEAGSDRMRRRINKNLNHQQILDAAATMHAAGYDSVKLYGMVGLPDETDEDVLQLAELIKTIKKQNAGMNVVLGCSSFVPKGGTPFQWQPKVENRMVDHRFALLRKSLAKISDFRPSSAKWDYFQAFLSRGDRRLAPLLIRFYELGGRLGSLNKAYKDLKNDGLNHFPDPDWYALRERPEDEILPWEAINLGTPKHILYREGRRPSGFQ
ncbi:MAG: radical SAM protein [Cyanobacteria bacterium P01_H01_bin.74]